MPTLPEIADIDQFYRTLDPWLLDEMNLLGDDAAAFVIGCALAAYHERWGTAATMFFLRALAADLPAIVARSNAHQRETEDAV